MERLKRVLPTWAACMHWAEDAACVSALPQSQDLDLQPSSTPTYPPSNMSPDERLNEMAVWRCGSTSADSVAPLARGARELSGSAPAHRVHGGLAQAQLVMGLFQQAPSACAKKQRNPTIQALNVVLQGRVGPFGEAQQIVGNTGNDLT